MIDLFYFVPSSNSQHMDSSHVAETRAETRIEQRWRGVAEMAIINSLRDEIQGLNSRPVCLNLAIFSITFLCTRSIMAVSKTIHRQHLVTGFEPCL